RRQEESWFTASRTFDGAVAVNGLLAPDAGEQLLETLSAFMPPPQPDDLRPAAQRRADALVDICRAAAVAGPQPVGAVRTVGVPLDWGWWRGEPAALSPPAGGGSGAPRGSGTPIPPGPARRLACDAKLLPIVLGGASEPLDLGRTARLVSPAL